jgi:ABC-type sugar transport system substrate-binding protein
VSRKLIMGIAVGITAAVLVVPGAMLAQDDTSLEGKKIGVIELYNNPFWVDAERGIREIADPLGVEITALNSNGNPQTQAENVTNLISAAVNGAIVGPVAPEGAEADLGRLIEAGIDTVCGDSCAVQESAEAIGVTGWATSAGADLGHGVGKAAADYIANELGGEAKIAMVVCDSLGPVCSVRHDAITEELAAVPNAEVVAMQDAFQTEKAQPLVVDMLTANPDVNIVITNNQGGTEGSVAAVKQLGLADSVKVFGIDMTNVAANYLLEEPPILLYTVGQDSYNMGKAAAQMLVNAWTGAENPEFKVVVPVQQFPREDVAAIEQYLADHEGM